MIDSNGASCGITDVILRLQSEEQAATIEKLLPHQRRRARRVVTYKRIDLRACRSNFPSAQQQAVLCDISVLGVGLIVKMPMKAGSQFLIRLESANVEMLYRVVRCRNVGDSNYSIGAEYLCTATGPNEIKSEEVERIQRFILA